VLRLLYIKDLRELQTAIDRIMVQAQVRTLLVRLVWALIITATLFSPSPQAALHHSSKHCTSTYLTCDL